MTIPRIQDKRLTEASGVCGSGLSNILLVIKDEPVRPHVFMIDERDGKTRGEFSYQKDPKDSEAIQRDPHGFAWTADCGDNDEKRKYIEFFGAKIPSLGTHGRLDTSVIRATFTDGKAHNVEAFGINPLTNDWLLISKASQGTIFRLERAISGYQFRSTGMKAGAYVTDMAYSKSGNYFSTIRKKSRVIDIYGSKTLKRVHSMNMPQEMEQPEGLTVSGKGYKFEIVSEGSHSPIQKVLIPEQYR